MPVSVGTPELAENVIVVGPKESLVTQAHICGSVGLKNREVPADPLGPKWIWVSQRPQEAA